MPCVQNTYCVCSHSLIYHALPFLGLEDEGFERLEQLAYLYLANNKVSHPFKCFFLNADLHSAHMIWRVYMFCVHLTIFLLCAILFWYIVPAGREGWQSPLIHSVWAYACNHIQYGCASWSELKCYWPFWTQSERERMDRFVCAFAGMNRQMGYRKNRGFLSAH